MAEKGYLILIRNYNNHYYLLLLNTIVDVQNKVDLVLRELQQNGDKGDNGDNSSSNNSIINNSTSLSALLTDIEKLNPTPLATRTFIKQNKIRNVLITLSPAMRIPVFNPMVYISTTFLKCY